MRYLGTWLLDLASSLPPPLAGTNEFVGTDLNPAHFPNPAPPNVTFSIHDIKQPWPETQNSRFHLVHQRLTLLGAGPNPSASISHLYSIVKPGGWVRISQGTMDKKLANEGAETCGAAVQALSKFAQSKYSASPCLPGLT